MAKQTLLAQVKGRCADLEPFIVARKLATNDETAAWRPGGSENPDKTAWAWVRYLMALSRFMGREDTQENTPASAATEAELLDALRSEPIEVELTDKDGEGRAKSVWVYPKSFDALLFCHSRDWHIGWLVDRLRMLELSATAEDALLLDRVLSEISYQYGLLIWAVTHEGPQLPFNPRKLVHWRKGRRLVAKLPEYVTEIDPWDVHRIAYAFTQVNVMRLKACEGLLDPTPRHEDGGKRPTWSIFMGTLAMEMKKDSKMLMRDVALVELLVSTRLKSAAMEQAKKDSEAERRTQKQEQPDGVMTLGER